MKRSALNDLTRNSTEAMVASLPKGNRKPKTPEETLDLNVILTSLQSMRDGDFTVRLPGTWVGLAGKVADTFNDIVAANQNMAKELKRVGHVVGKQGMTRERTRFHESRGAWGEMEVSVNTLVEDLLRPTNEVTRTIAAVAQGDLTQTVRLDVDGRPLEGEFLRSANLVNTMIQQLGVFTAEVTRLTREVGTDGKLGGQAVVPGVAGTWKDLTDNVNFMASNLTGQVRNIAEVATAAARGDLSRKISVDVKGEILELTELRRLSARLMTMQDEERRRIAREIHDGLGQELAAAKMILDGILAKDTSPSMQQASLEASQLVDRAIQQVRTISHLLHPPLLDEVGLTSALRWFLEGLSERSRINVHLDVHPPGLTRLKSEVETAIFRIVQEALTNMFRHSGARNGRVAVAENEDNIVVTVSDDGKGIEDEVSRLRPESVGVGIGGMRQRVMELGGSLRLANANPGTIVEVIIPTRKCEAKKVTITA